MKISVLQTREEDDDVYIICKSLKYFYSVLQIHMQKIKGGRMMDEIIIHTDGGCRGNADDENIGGWGVVLEYKGYVKELYAGERNTTNNIQELKGAINALEALKTTYIPIKLYCDSAYVVNGINQWVKGWKKKGWRKGDGKAPENLELWKRLDKLVNMQKDLKVIKVRGHNGNKGNELADELANKAMDEVV
jgi:ribonuclease HI